MPSTVTVVGKVGPGLTLASQLFNNVTFFSIHPNKELLEIDFTDNNGPRKMFVDIAAAATILITVTGADYTVTIAN